MCAPVTLFPVPVGNKSDGYCYTGTTERENNNKCMYMYGHSTVCEGYYIVQSNNIIIIIIIIIITYLADPGSWLISDNNSVHVSFHIQ